MPPFIFPCVTDDEDEMAFLSGTHKRSLPSHGAFESSQRRAKLPRITDELPSMDDVDDSLFLPEEVAGDDDAGNLRSPNAIPINDHSQSTTTQPSDAYATMKPQSNSTNGVGGRVSPPRNIAEHAKIQTSDNHPSSTRRRVVDGAKIKEEETSPHSTWLTDESLSPETRVRVYVGKRNKQLFAKRSDLEKSPVLSSFIAHDAEQGAYIMRPSLYKMDYNDFDAILQFLHSADFTPRMISKNDDKVWEDIRGTGAYSYQLVRFGRIYVDAQKLEVEGLEDLIFKKISELDIQKFSIRSFLQLAQEIFSDARTTVGVDTRSTEGSSNGHEGEPQKDRLEEWVIGQIAGNLQEITNNHHDLFWLVASRTTKRLFFARVLEEAAVRHRTSGGKLPTAVVELD